MKSWAKEDAQEISKACPTTKLVPSVTLQFLSIRGATRFHFERTGAQQRARPFDEASRSAKSVGRSLSWPEEARGCIPDCPDRCRVSPDCLRERPVEKGRYPVPTLRAKGR